MSPKLKNLLNSIKKMKTVEYFLGKKKRECVWQVW